MSTSSETGAGMTQEATDAFKAVLRAAVDAYQYERFSEIRIWMDDDGDMRLVYLPADVVQGGFAAVDVARRSEQPAR
ncbi:MAG: hypothetical protein NVS2B16_01320 [Chloroflexota bacterium]